MRERGLARLRRHEAFRARVYSDAADNSTIGYGHMLRPEESFEGGVTLQAGQELFARDVAGIVNPALDKVAVALNQNQVDALGSFIFNAGPGSFERSVLPAINAGDFERATAEMSRFTKGRNQRTGERAELRGLVRRRREEILLFNSPVADSYSLAVVRAVKGAFGAVMHPSTVGRT